jgi:hypothetical protein
MKERPVDRAHPGLRCGLRRLSWLLGFGALIALHGHAQTAFISDAWWTFQQDCNGDGCKAGTLPGDFARLNWSANVVDCNGILSVFEIIYSRPSGSVNWTALYTNASHTITGCRSTGEEFLDVQMAGGCLSRDYKIEVYRDSQTDPDDIRSDDNDADLAAHREQLLSQDFCLSDFFATCAALNGPSGSESDENTYATKEPGEPDHAGNPGGKSLWYCWRATNATPVTFDTIGSTFDTLLAVYTGDSISNLSLVASNDDIAGWTNRQARVAFTPVPGTTYHIAVDGYGGGSGIMQLNWNQTGAELPDLIIWGPSASPTVITRTFTNNDCEVLEGCATPGDHRLLSFSTETRNIGAGDLELGDPATNSLFRWASCHQHYHFEQYAEYNLLDTNGNLVATGHKVGFCLMDGHPRSPTANPHNKYTCAFQGLQSGWGDVYGAGLPCQYIDVTTVLPGNYVLQMTVNPDNLFAEANIANNTTLVPVTIPPPDCLVAPLNDNFSNAVQILQTPFTFSGFNNCAGSEPGEPLHTGSVGGHSVWFSWTPASDQIAVVDTKGSDFDTMLAIYVGDSVSNLTSVAGDDDIIPGVYLTSQVSFSATAGTTYWIAVDGYQGAVGTVVLNLNPPANDDFAQAFIISGSAGTTNGSTIGASKEPYELAHAFDVGGHSIWYLWTAPDSGPADINTLGSTFNTTLAVYTDGSVGSSGNLTNFVLVAASDDDVGAVQTSRVDFYAVAGTTYQIAIDGFGAESGRTTLNWNMRSELGIQPLPGGDIRLTLTGVDWQRYTLLSSTDLLTWFTNMQTITLSGGLHLYTNSPSTNTSGRQFYRALLAP